MRTAVVRRRWIAAFPKCGNCNPRETFAPSRLVEQGLQTFPSEARLVQLQSSIKKGIEEARRREAGESKRLRQDAAATLTSDAEHLDDITQIYAMPESVPHSAERPAVPVEESGRESIREESWTVPSVEPRQRELPVPAASGGQHAASLPTAQRRLWAAGALAALAVLLLFFVVSRISTRAASHRGCTPETGTLEITTVPPGAAISINGRAMGTATGTLQAVDRGSVEIEAKLPGYQTLKRTIDLAGGAQLPVALTLLPVLALKLLLPMDGRVSIDNEEPVLVEDGEFLRKFALGSHTVKVSTGRNGVVDFAFEVRPEGPAILTAPPSSQQVSALWISNFGEQARIYTGAASMDVKLDGQPLGQVDRNGLDLSEDDAWEP